jgi:hypothetical protein
MTADADDRRRVRGEPAAVDDDTRAFDGFVRADVRDGGQSSRLSASLVGGAYVLSSSASSSTFQYR